MIICNIGDLYFARPDYYSQERGDVSLKLYLSEDLNLGVTAKMDLIYKDVNAINGKYCIVNNIKTQQQKLRINFLKYNLIKYAPLTY